MKKYRMVKVGDVVPTPKTKNQSQWTVQNKYIHVKCHHYREKCTCQVVAYQENLPATPSEIPFLGSFMEAYNTHRDVILSPDDIWMQILLKFTEYVNDHAEQMRHFFVTHEGTKELTVTTENDLEESQWNEFFTLIIDAIKNNTKEGVTDLLQSNFSTTTCVEKVLSTAVIMDTFKKYFTYGRCIPACGIRNVLFMGTLDDWNSLLNKLKELRKFAVDNEWERYVDELVPVIIEFINTYNGVVDSTFWIHIMNINYEREGSGSTRCLSGWILKFYGIYTKCKIADITNKLIDVPVKVTNKNTNTIKTMSIVGGFGGIHNETTEQYDAYRPQMSFIIFHDGNVATEASTGAAGIPWIGYCRR